MPSGGDRKKRPIFSENERLAYTRRPFSLSSGNAVFSTRGEGKLVFFVTGRWRELQKWLSGGVEKGPISGVHFAPMSVSRRRERAFREKRTNFARLSEKRGGDKPQSGPRRTPPKWRFVNTLQHFWPFLVFGRFSIFYAIFERIPFRNSEAQAAASFVKRYSQIFV